MLAVHGSLAILWNQIPNYILFQQFQLPMAIHLMSEKKQYQPTTCQVIVCKSTFAMQKQLKNLTTTEQLNIISISGDESLPMLASF
jgi:hypothetical protein